MANFVSEHFWTFDLLVAGATLALVVLLGLAGRVSRFVVRAFVVGCLLGSCWEIPLSTLDALGVVRVFDFLSPPPGFVTIIVSHTLWDGGLFVAGVLFVRLACNAPRWTKFFGLELIVLVAWGQAQELGVELLATGTAGWTYVPARWNPQIFAFHGRSITLVPQLVWLVAPLVFHACLVRLARSERASRVGGELAPSV